VSKIVPADIVMADDQPPSSTLEIDYDVKIELIALELDIPDDADEYVDLIPKTPMKVRCVCPNRESHVVVDLYEIHSVRLARYLPSRVYYDDAIGAFVLLYYTSPMIQTPCFAPDGVVYCCSFPIDPYCVYKYDVRARVFIDQIKVGNAMHCFMIFTNDSHDLLVSPNES